MPASGAFADHVTRAHGVEQGAGLSGGEEFLRPAGHQFEQVLGLEVAVPRGDGWLPFCARWPPAACPASAL
jgi:hypothetical protein